jgi:uncharacterized protein (TIRG00374 family)
MSTSGRPHSLPLWLRIVLTAIVLVASVWFVVLPQLDDARSALESLRSPPVLLILAAIVLEGASNAAYSALTARIMGRKRLSYFSALRIDAADLGVNHVVPGGGAAAAAVRYKLFVRMGIPAREALSGAMFEITLSNIALGLLFGAGLVVSLPALGGSGYFTLTLVTVLALFGSAAFVGWALLRRRVACVRVARWIGAHVRRIGSDRAESFVVSIAQRVDQLVHEPRKLWATSALAVGNWLLDAGALWLMFVAFGQAPSFGTVIIVYGLGSILAMLPLTPGGLGLVEGVMVPAFVALGVPDGTAVLAVVGWRVLEYWLPIPIAAIAYSSLRFTIGRMERRTRAQHERLTPTPLVGR